MYTVKALPQNIHLGFYSAELKPVLTIRSGDVVEIETSRAELVEQVAEPLRSEMAALAEKKKREGFMGPHTLTGPIYIAEAGRGDVLEVHIEEIRLRSEYGMNKSTPTGILAKESIPSFSRAFHCINREKKLAENIFPGVSIPLQPFFGNLGVAPPARYGRVSSTAPGIHCGNLDIKDLIAGSTLYMPVQVEGALFSCGDGHGCQADGEADGTALEMPLTGVFKFIVRHDMHLKYPMAETPGHYMTIAYHTNLKAAARDAVREMVQFLSGTKGLSEEDAYILVSLVGEMRVSQLVNVRSGVHFMIPKEIFKAG